MRIRCLRCFWSEAHQPEAADDVTSSEETDLEGYVSKFVQVSGYEGRLRICGKELGLPKCNVARSIAKRPKCWKLKREGADAGDIRTNDFWISLQILTQDLNRAPRSPPKGAPFEWVSGHRAAAVTFGDMRMRDA